MWRECTSVYKEFFIFSEKCIQVSDMFYFERVTIVADFKHASLLKINSEI